MSNDATIVFAVLGVAGVLFASGRVRLDVTALLVVLTLMLTGVLTPREALAGFGDPVVLLVAGLLVVGEMLTRPGVTYAGGRQRGLLGCVGGGPPPLRRRKRPLGNVGSGSSFGRAIVPRVRPHHWLIPSLILATAGFASASEPERSVPFGTEPTLVYVKAFVVDVDDISSVDQSFSASVYLEFRWHDPSLAHDGSRAVTIPRSHPAYPGFKIVNAQRVMDSFGGDVEVSADGQLRLRRRLWGRFSQILDLRDFPFDHHTFGIHISAVIPPGTLRFVADPGGPSGMSKRLSLADWEISGFAARSREYEPIPGETPLPGFLISFDGERRVSHYVAKVIVPLVLIVAMAGLVFWIDPKQATSQISVAVTTMLTLIAYRFAVGSELPNLHYLTRMDEFLLGSTVLVFTCLVTVVITSGLANRDRLERARSIDRWARWLFPLTFLLVTLRAFVF